MSYDTPEGSVSDAQPYFLYLFDNGIKPVRLTSDATRLQRTIGGTPYWFEKSPVRHGNLEQTGSIEKSSVEFTFPLSDKFARSLLPAASEITTVTVWRGHHTDLTDTLRVVWKGRVVGAMSAAQSIEVVSESIFTSLRRPGCRARYQRTCRHALYHQGCNLDKADFAVAATVTAIDGLALTIPVADDQPDGEYKAGMIEYAGAFGFFSAHVGQVCTLLNPLPGLNDATLPVSVTIYPGCDLSVPRCNDRFDNIENNGSFPFMPDENPFSISIV
ncbi:phage BR0599 family protein [Mesorhizobium sp. YM1C-6-2]|uniref:phage BR0599 family protein n=1 Tax=Mesorhizobium sp. YM1C-6-2 TaxID=1827501 RepID=UPI000EF24896|nr:phage BR0599 family protein [Mesorhizobium sp. YM1C-6-2]RLP22271.1 DUF2163 domain-containing protein [Mesorhizobium sp. YM1C-6-2]